MTILSVLKSKYCECYEDDKVCAKALQKHLKLKGWKKKKARKKKHRVASVPPTVPPTHRVAETTVPPTAVPPNPKATAQNVEARIPHFTLFNEREHFVDLMSNIGAEAYSKFKNIYDAQNNQGFFRSGKRIGRPKGSRNKPVPMAGSVGSLDDGAGTPDERYASLRRHKEQLYGTEGDETLVEGDL